MLRFDRRRVKATHAFDRTPVTIGSMLAGLIYALIVFAIGSVIGTIRILVLAPRVGATAAVALELPVMLIASWLSCSWVVGHFEVASRLAMSVVAFVTLMVLELGLSVLIFHRSLREHVSAYATVPGRIGLAGQVVFAIFPILVRG